MVAKPRVRATYADIEALPRHMVGELVGGVLHAHPRPALPHALAASALGEELGPPFKRGRGGPGGWMILFEPELHFGEDVLVPDVASCRTCHKRSEVRADCATCHKFHPGDNRARPDTRHPATALVAEAR